MYVYTHMVCIKLRAGAKMCRTNVRYQCVCFYAELRTVSMTFLNVESSIHIHLKPPWQEKCNNKRFYVGDAIRRYAFDGDI